jgi:hypothetical protein
LKIRLKAKTPYFSAVMKNKQEARSKLYNDPLKMVIAQDNKTLLERIDLQTYIIDQMHEHTDDIFKELQHFDTFDDPKVLRLVFDYNYSTQHAAEKVIAEVTDEYKRGITDPTRLVGRMERKKGRHRKKIEGIKQTFGNNASNSVTIGIRK